MDAYQDVVYRIVQNPFDFPIIADTSMCWTYTSGERLVLGAVAPSWRGIRSFFKNHEVADVIDGFAFFASQYVLRSRIVRVQAGLSLAYGATCDFRDADIERITIGPSSPWVDMGSARDKVRARFPEPHSRRSRRSRELDAWVRLLNPLDPFIHRALFQFWRANALAHENFWEEAVTALDGVTAVGAEAIHRWQNRHAQPSRPETGELLGMTPYDQRQLEKLYNLRCTFGAHPPPTKWWDFTELYDDEFEGYFDVTRRFLRYLCTYESSSRRIETDPQSWADWFCEHAEMLLDVAWFTKLPH